MALARRRARSLTGAAVFSAPAAAELESEDDQLAQGGALLGFARECKCSAGIAAGSPAGAPAEVKRDTSVVSTASCEPPQSASPFAMTSMRRSSCRATSTLRSRSRTLRATVASASRQMRAAARSTPDRGHAARWSPKRSCSCRQRQRAEVKGRGRRSRRRSNTRKSDELRDSSGEAGLVVKTLAA